MILVSKRLAMPPSDMHEVNQAKVMCSRRARKGCCAASGVAVGEDDEDGGIVNVC